VCTTHAWNTLSYRSHIHKPIAEEKPGSPRVVQKKMMIINEKKKKGAPATTHTRKHKIKTH